MTREQMLELIRESFKDDPLESLARAEKVINDFYDRRETGQNSESKNELEQQKS